MSVVFGRYDIEMMNNWKILGKVLFYFRVLLERCFLNFFLVRVFCDFLLVMLNNLERIFNGILGVGDFKLRNSL